MSDIFREVDEEVRQDQVQRFVVRYWGWLLLAALAVIAAVGAWRGYDYYRVQRAQEAGGRYLDALQLARDGKSVNAIAALDELGKGGNTGYPLLARFRAAAQLGQSDAAAGVKAYDALSADGTIDPAFQDVARIRAAILIADTADLAEMKRRLAGLADANSAMRNPARELLAISAIHAGDFDAAGSWLDAIMTDATATTSLRQRAEALMGLVTSGKAGKAG